ncbi:acetyltransferase [Shewanella chilikensis]|uniref:acetyltransferase n=1 Tax=Shewanella chilikensis TaxID=558541 RepID=UPI00399BDC93
MTKCIAILGAGGHGKVVAELAELNGYDNIIFYDDNWPSLKNVGPWPIVGKVSDLFADTAKLVIVVGIGNNDARLELQRKLTFKGAHFVTLIHPNATVSRYAKIGLGSVIMANAVVNPFANIGDACIVNTSATIDHDCVVSDGVHISPGANLAGTVIVGEKSWVGIGSQIKQKISIGSNVIIGAGSSVINDIPNFQTVVGIPAKVVLKSK